MNGGEPLGKEEMKRERKEGRDEKLRDQGEYPSEGKDKRKKENKSLQDRLRRTFE